MIKFFSICTILKLNITDPKKDLHKEKYKNKKIDLQICYIQENHVMTLNNISETKTDNHGKQPFPKTFLSNLFFCVLSAYSGVSQSLCKPPN